VLVSPAVRARQTWAAAAPAFPPAEVRLEEALYHAEASDIRRVALTQGEAFATVMVVGHNPGLHDLTLELFAEGDGQGPSRQLRGFPTAAAAVFLFDARGRPAFDGVFTAGRGG
jgi:phosphohistidine phosphatase